MSKFIRIQCSFVNLDNITSISFSDMTATVTFTNGKYKNFSFSTHQDAVDFFQKVLIDEQT